MVPENRRRRVEANLDDDLARPIAHFSHILSLFTHFQLDLLLEIVNRSLYP